MPALSLIYDFLTGRQQCVFINQQRSSVLLKQFEVLQGSVLGPLFLSTSTSTFAKYLKFTLCYADGYIFIISYSSVCNLERICEAMNKDIEQLGCL